MFEIISIKLISQYYDNLLADHFEIKKNQKVNCSKIPLANFLL